MRRLIVATAFTFCVIQNSSAQNVAATQHSSGVSFQNTGLLDTDTDTTYKAFEKVRNGRFGRYDFYYSLEIVPQFKEKYSTCELNPNFESYAQAFFGYSAAGITAVKADIQYRWTSGNVVDFLKGDAGLVLAATGTNPQTLNPGNGCYFDETMRPTFPLLQYQGAGPNDTFDDFVIKFIAIGGRAEKYNIVSSVTSLFSSIAAIAGWSAITSGASQGFVNLANSFQAAMQAAGTTQNQMSLNYNLKAVAKPNEGRIIITIPQMFGGNPNNGNMVIFVRRQASIVLTGLDANVTVGTVTDNFSLANRQCNPAAIAGGTCNANTDTLRTALAKLVKSVDTALGDGTNPALKLFDPTSSTRQKVIFQMCEALRDVSRLNLHLSTVDEMMIRWAFEKEAGLLDQLKDATKLAALAAANGVQPKALVDKCWNDGDQATFDGMLKNLDKKVADAQ